MQQIKSKKVNIILSILVLLIIVGSLIYFINTKLKIKKQGLIGEGVDNEKEIIQSILVEKEEKDVSLNRASPSEGENIPEEFLG